MGAESGALTAEQVDQYNRDGYLVLPNFATQEEMEEMRQQAGRLLEDFDPQTVSVFSTKNQKKLMNDYFLESASGVHFFFEEKAFDEAGKLRQPKVLSINKMGHAMHDLDPVFKKFSRSPKMAKMLASLGYRRPLPVQSMYIFKQPNIGGEVLPHQDSTFLITDPLSCTGIWVALEDATVHNGCLWTLPGAHQNGVACHFIRAPDNKVSYDHDPPKRDLDQFVPLEMKAGSLVLLHGANVHYSKENTSPISRHAYSVHYIEGAPGHSYPAENWLQRSVDLPFVPLYES